MSDLDRQPWDPDPLAVGTLVRVRHGGECTAWVHEDNLEALDGAIGVIAHLWNGEEIEGDLPGHVYYVRFRPRVPVPLPGHPLAECAASTFARAELERLPGG